MSLGQQVSYQFFPKIIYFSIFLSKFKGLKCKKLRETEFSEKLSFWLKIPNIFPIFSFLSFSKKFNPLISLFYLQKWFTAVFFMILWKRHFWEKCPKILSTNQIIAIFDDQFIWKQSIDTSGCLDSDNCQWKKGSMTISFGWV